MKNSSKVALVIFSTVCAIVIIVFLGISVIDYVKHDPGVVLSKNPKITEFTDEDITKVENELLFKFPENTKLTEAQYHYSPQDAWLGVVFEIPVDKANDFLDKIKRNFKELSKSTPDIAEDSYQSLSRQYTSMTIYSEKNGYKKVKYSYYRPSNSVLQMFLK